MKWNLSNLRSRLPGCSVKRKIGKQGFTLIELLFVVTILGVLVTILAPTMRDFLYRVRVARTISEISGMQRQIAAYVASNEKFPATLAVIGTGGKVPNDVWGRPYEYSVPGGLRTYPITTLPLNSLVSYDLYSRGKDGLTSAPLDGAGAADDIVRANDGSFVGLASEL